MFFDILRFFCIVGIPSLVEPLAEITFLSSKTRDRGLDNTRPFAILR